MDVEVYRLANRKFMFEQQQIYCRCLHTQATT